MAKLKLKSKKEGILFGLVFAFFAIFSFTLIFPFFWFMINSFKMDVEFRADSFALPTRWIFANFYDAITYTYKGSTMFNLLLNSLICVVGVTGLGLFFACCTSYVISKYKFKGRMFLFNLVLVIICIPGIGTTATVYRFYNQIGIYDHFFCLFLSGSGGFSTGFLLLYATFSNISWTYAEAGLLDGASNFRVFLTIMLPQALPTVVSLAIITGIGVWNDYFSAYMYLPSHPTVALGIYNIQLEATTKQQYPLLFAMILISMTPVFVLFLLAQNTIMESVTAGGIKG